MIDFSRTTQSSQLEHTLKAEMYDRLNKAAQNSQAIRFTALSVALSSSLLSVMTGIAAIGENIFKGTINIFGGCCVEKLSVTHGFKQLFLGTFFSLCDLVRRIFKAALNLFIGTAAIITDPEFITRTRRNEHREEIERIVKLEPPRFYYGIQ